MVRRKGSLRMPQKEHHNIILQALENSYFFFCKQKGHLKKDCPNYAKWCVKKDKFLTLVCSEFNLAFVPTNTWWIDFDATTYISVPMQICGVECQMMLKDSSMWDRTKQFQSKLLGFLDYS